MRKTLFFLLPLTLIVAFAAAQSRPSLPPGHPPTQTRPALPSGHPPVTTAPARPLPGAVPVVRAEDVGDASALVDAYYASVSGPPGTARDWDRFRSLFLPGARLVTSASGGDPPIILTPEQFVQVNRKYFEVGGYFEAPICTSTDAFADIAHVFSTYESRRRPEDEPYARGINSFQLLRANDRWWIVSVMWDRGTPHTPVPTKYLPPLEFERGP